MKDVNMYGVCLCWGLGYYVVVAWWHRTDYAYVGDALCIYKKLHIGFEHSLGVCVIACCWCM